MKKILCIGEALVDMICTDKGKPLSEGENFLKKAGGAPTNVAAAVAALGGRAELVAKVGKDPFGQHLVDVLKSFNVGTQWMLQDENYFTTLAFVSLMENGERDFYFNRGADGQLTSEEVNRISLDGFSIVHFGSATAFLPGPLQAAYQSLLQKARQQELFISFDPNYRNLLFQHDQQSFIQQSRNFLNYCHFFKLSDEEALLLTGRSVVMDAASDLLSSTKAAFAITIGKEGALLGLNGKTETISGVIVKPVDTTGAGDAFVGAVLFQLSQYPDGNIKKLPAEEWRKIIYKANKAGAKTCEHFGAMEALRYLSHEIFNDN